MLSWNGAATSACRILGLLLGLGLSCGAFAQSADQIAFLGGRNALWNVVGRVCAPMARNVGFAAPCLKVDLEKRYAVVRAPNDSSRILITPTERVPGLESPALTKPGAPNFWALAWGERRRVAEALPKAPGPLAIGMAVNGRRARSQDQLHIHVACIASDVRQGLVRARLPQKGWSDIVFGEAHYRLRRLSRAELDANPFLLAAKELPVHRDGMRGRSLAVLPIAAAEGREEFALLVNDQARAAETLLDLDCARPS